jgi:hypothetical protein
MADAYILAQNRPSGYVLGSQRSPALVYATRRTPASVYVSTMGLSRTQLEQWDAMRDKLATIPRGAGMGVKESYPLWAITPNAESARPPFSINSAYVEVAQQRLPATVWRDSGRLVVTAVLEIVHPASPSSIFIPMFQLRAAPDYASDSSVSSSVRGKTPTALGTWAQAAVATMTRVDSNAGNLDRLFFRWEFTQGRVSGSTFSQDWIACAEWNDPSSLAAPMIRDSKSGNKNIDAGCTPIDVSRSNLLSFQVKTQAALTEGSVTLISTHAEIELPRLMGPILR